MAEALLYANDNLIELSGLTNIITGLVVDDATVQVTLKDDAGVDVTGETWPLTMASTGSDGDYQATLKDTLGVSVGRRYKATIVVKSGADIVATFNVQVRVLERGER